MTLTFADLERVADILPGLYRVEDLSQFPEQALAVVRALLPGVSHSYNDVDAAAGQIMETVQPHDLTTSVHHELLERHQAEHPVIAHFVRTGDGRPHAISDFVTRSAFQRRALYAELYRTIGCEDQLSIGIGVVPRFVGICVNRDRWQFTDDDRLKLELVRSHLGSAYEMAAERTMTRQILAAGDLGVVRIGADGRSIDADDRARESLAACFDDWSPLSCALPDDLYAWVRVQRDSFEVDPGAPLEPLVVERRGVSLRIRLVPGTGAAGPSLIVRRDARPFSSETTQRLGLSPREAEVLRLLASGVSSAAIAESLVVSQHTVHRHLQNLYAKLGVRTRTAAIAKVLEVEPPR